MEALLMLGIGLGLMAILCAVGLIAGGGLFMHQEWKGKKNHPLMEQDIDPGKVAESSNSPTNKSDLFEDFRREH